MSYYIIAVAAVVEAAVAVAMTATETEVVAVMASVLVVGAIQPPVLAPVIRRHGAASSGECRPGSAGRSPK